MRLALIGTFDGQAWRDEYLIARALAQLGHDVVTSPWHAPVILRDLDLTIVRKGYGLPAASIETMRQATGRPVVLWHAEVLGDQWPIRDPVAQGKAAHLQQNVRAYDLVCHHSADALPIVERLGARRVAWVPAVGVDPAVHRHLPIPKDIDVGVYGWASERRLALVHAVLARIPADSPAAWPDAAQHGVYGERLVQYLNRCRVVLNVHYSASPNTETRLFESLGCGVPCVSEPISMPELFPSGVGVLYGETPQALAQAIERVLTCSEDEYAGLREAGSQWVHTHHTMRQRCQALLDVVAKEVG